MLRNILLMAEDVSIPCYWVTLSVNQITINKFNLEITSGFDRANSTINYYVLILPKIGVPNLK